MGNRERSVPQTLLTGVAAGLAAGAVVGLVDRLTDRLVSKEQKRREKEIREDSAHKMAGPHFARKLLGREPSEEEQRAARAIFAGAYGVIWGLIYAVIREKYPGGSRWMGLPLAVPFFLACDGTMAPLLGISPGIQRLPWQINAKEMTNHIAWTFTAETIHRLAGGVSAGR